MPVPEELSKTWSEAAAMMDKGDNDLALENLENHGICVKMTPRRQRR